MLEGKTFSVEMSEAVAGIKGTTFVVEDDGKTSTLKVIEGHVEFTSKASGESEMVGPGEMISADDDGLEEKEYFDATDENESWSDVGTSAYAAKSGADGVSVLVMLLLIVIMAAVSLGVIFYRKKK
jgi:hypothetical protein